MPSPRIFVIGASAGGVEALIQLMKHLPADFPGSLFVVLHTVAGGESQLPQILSRAGPLKAVHPEDGDEILPGMVYVARPNHHLMIEDGRVRSAIGPRQNGYRPSVNALFASAAQAYGSAVTGVVLSGSLDDGTIGLQEIKSAGGIAVVQDPADAVFTGMPRSAIENVDVDYTCPVSQMASVLVDIGQREAIREKATMEKSGNPTERPVARPVDESIEQVAGFTCPECGGVLREEHTGELVQFRCHVGHLLSEQALLRAQGDTLEAALWTALRVLEERVQLAERMSQRAAERGHAILVSRFEEQNRDAREKAEVIRRVLLGGEGMLSVTSFQDDVSDEEVPRGAEGDAGNH